MMATNSDVDAVGGGRCDQIRHRFGDEQEPKLGAPWMEEGTQLGPQQGGRGDKSTMYKRVGRRVGVGGWGILPISMRPRLLRLHPSTGDSTNAEGDKQGTEMRVCV